MLDTSKYGVVEYLLNKSVQIVSAKFIIFVLLCLIIVNIAVTIVRTMKVTLIAFKNLAEY